MDQELYRAAGGGDCGAAPIQSRAVDDVDGVQLRKDIPEINSDLNAKGVTRQAFDMFRLKICVDFHPHEGEQTYLKFEKLDGFARAFDKYNDGFLLDLNTPYDYESVLHYGPYSFNINSNVPSTTTKIPEFNDIIGQRLDFSRTDLLRLNCMYNCSKSFFSHMHLKILTQVSCYMDGVTQEE
ncbi:meprin a subunit alpha-like [Limosa lapponica baueri]|uniref:Meprin a subunit alpha-like n=1 Tax=Limosa lapponica baueri TaxID=1758121 RepID=A0A2I0T9T5_LIMLA|nr:meprin a subunit alpha-like [Limosa lapponica baueri]